MTFTDKITVNAQSSIRIDWGQIIRFDPLNIDGNPSDADIIFITHEHFDHFSTSDLTKVLKKTTCFVFPKSMSHHIKDFVPLAKIIEVEPGDTAELNGFKIKAVPAYNKTKPFHPQKNGWTGYVVSKDGISVYVAGDTDALPENDKLDVDIALVPIGGKFTMNAKEAAQFVNKMSPKVVIPIHYGTANSPQEFAKLVDKEIETIIKLGLFGAIFLRVAFIQ